MASRRNDTTPDYHMTPTSDRMTTTSDRSGPGHPTGPATSDPTATHPTATGIRR